MSKLDVRIGNALDVLRGMDQESVDVCVTSPPYWALRDYGSEPVIWGGTENCQHDFQDGPYCSKCRQWRGQLGLEPDPNEYVEHLCSIFDEVYRVLKPTGACWVNIGDTYGTVSGSGFDRWRNNKTQKSSYWQNELKKKNNFVRDKCLVQIPSRFAIAMQDRGWILRNECIWYKPNQMPISVKDRFTVDFEKFFFFVKEPRYYFKQQFEPIKDVSVQRQHRQRHNTGDNGVIRGTNAYDVRHNDPNWTRWANPESRNKRTVWAVNLKGSGEQHVQMYPHELIDTPIQSCCPPGGVVLDPFCGSGTTLEYCKIHNIDAVGIEINPAYEGMIKRKSMFAQRGLDDYHISEEE